ncbi:MAG: AAA family ATPase, partial [Planctomycetota bacterium]|nr:AAA family ATPase [Planctomycetota bacterium]
MRIERIEIDKYLLLKNVYIEPSDFTVVVGDNESGKTMLLDSILDGLFHLRERERAIKALFPSFSNRYQAIEPPTMSLVV